MVNNNSKKKKGGFCVAVIGRVESGKTPTIKKMIAATSFKQFAILDIQREYEEKENFKIFWNIDNFKKYILQTTKTFIVCEEATAFIDRYKNIDWARFCISIAHQNNIIVFVFHSLMDANKDILRRCKYIHLFPTLDDPKDVRSERSRFYEFFKYPNNQKPVIINNYKL